MTFFKWTALGVGGVVAVAHIGVLGHIITATKVPEHQLLIFLGEIIPHIRLRQVKKVIV